MVVFLLFTDGCKIVNFRYPDDPHDRIWKVLANPRSWSPTNTTAAVRYVARDPFEVPSAVLQTAITVDDGFSVQFYWDADGSDSALVYFVALHIAEVKALNSSEARICEIYVNNDLWYAKPFSPVYLYSSSVLGTVTGRTEYTFRIEPTVFAKKKKKKEPTDNSTLPPILNALEIYLMVPTAERATDGGDGIYGLKSQKLLLIRVCVVYSSLNSESRHALVKGR